MTKPKAPIEVPDVPGLDRNAFREWVEYRAVRKPKILPVSYPKLVQAFLRLGVHQQAAVDNSITNGWQGLFAPKDARVEAGMKPGEAW